MNDVSQVTQVAKGISDYGMMAITAAFFLLLSAAMMVALFRWFKSIIEQMMQDQKDSMHNLAEETRKQNDMLQDISEGLRPETLLRIRNLTGFAFDLSIEQVCRLIKRVREENHIIDHEATAAKIRKSLLVIHNDRNSRFDSFTYRGKSISEFCSSAWVEDVAKIVEGEIYNEDGANNARAYTNIKLAYDNIKTDFYQRLNA
ncbi:MAG: hypothetical protein [Bacteriophage sp.]|uniref:hypothetical protein n=1 Tax=Leyella stercorea TaxID=363265 RepID=UPI0022006879|nr:hypothetical protein [Prevotella sp.]MDD7644024.1 hypothetical protein [Leyella stercorea]MDY4089513.1 hypothetical protein [Prevotella sp.]UWH91951.1 MAG: hypothetical protein [Bacteriophage sp.]